MAESSESFYARFEHESEQLSLDPESIDGDKKTSLDTVEDSDLKLAAEMPAEGYRFTLTQNLDNLSFGAASQNQDTFCPPDPNLFPFKEEYLPFIVDEINKREAIKEISFYSDTPFAALTDKGAAYIARHLTDRVTAFNFHETSISDRSLKALSKREALRSLFIGNTNVTDEGIKELVNCKVLRNLDISNCPKLTPQCGIYLARCKKLNLLSMYNGFSSTTNDVKRQSELNELFIRNLAWSTSLTKIEFQQTEVSDGLATSLFNMPNLTFADLTHANISEQAKQRLRETTQRRINEKLAEPAQTTAVLLGTKVVAGASSPILNAFVKNTLYDKKLCGEIIDFMRSKEPPRELHSKFKLEDH